MYFQFILFRVKQVYRIIKEIGIPLFLVAILILSGIFFRFLSGLSNLEPSVITLLVSLSILTLHLTRKDSSLLSAIFPKRVELNFYLGLEYFLLTLPLVFYHLISLEYRYALCAMIVAFFIPWLCKSKSLTLGKKRWLSLDWISLCIFELRITIERQVLGFIFFWLVSFLAFVHFGYLCVGVFGCIIMSLSAYNYNEPIELLEPDFLLKKLLSTILFFSMLFGVQFLMVLFRHDISWLLLVFVFLYLIVIPSLALVYKYAKYHPLSSANYNSSFMAFAMILSLLPGLILVYILSLFYYYFQANKRIQSYLC